VARPAPLCWGVWLFLWIFLKFYSCTGVDIADNISIMMYMSEQQQTCPECGKPVGNDHPYAKVYHMACMMKVTEVQRERQRQIKKDLDAKVQGTDVR